MNVFVSVLVGIQTMKDEHKVKTCSRTNRRRTTGTTIHDDHDSGWDCCMDRLIFVLLVNHRKLKLIIRAIHTATADYTVLCKLLYQSPIFENTKIQEDMKDPPDEEARSQNADLESFQQCGPDLCFFYWLLSSPLGHDELHLSVCIIVHQMNGLEVEMDLTFSKFCFFFSFTSGHSGYVTIIITRGNTNTKPEEKNTCSLRTYSIYSMFSIVILIMSQLPLVV